MRAVFLDRDGVLNRTRIVDGKPYPPRSLAELKILPDARDALLRFREHGYRLIVVTNQPDISRGSTTRAEVDLINAEIARVLPVDAIFVCDHDDKDACDCRKPLPGLLLKGRDRFGVHLGKSFMVGDRWRDIEAGLNAGCRTIFIDYHYAEKRPPRAPDFTCTSLGDAADWVLAADRPRRAAKAAGG